MRAWLRKLCLGLLVAGLALVALEGAARIGLRGAVLATIPTAEMRNFLVEEQLVYDPVLGWRPVVDIPSFDNFDKPNTAELLTPPLPLLVPAETFDGLNWHPSTTLTWRCATESLALNALDDQMPLGLAFVLRVPWPSLPTELAWLHTGRAHAAALGITDELALAPYAIDDATDLLYAERRPPAATFWLAADNVNALYWALHDWSHFHNHGEFTDRPATELQCDAAALAWLWINRGAVGLPDAHWEELRRGALANHEALRAVSTGTRCPPPVMLADAVALRALAEGLSGRDG